MWHVVAFPLNAGASLVLLVFRVPLLGRLLGQGVRVAQELISQALNLGDVILRAAGIRVAKVLRLHLIVLRAKGVPVSTVDALGPQIHAARQAFAAAGVALMVAVGLDNRDAPAGVLDVGCNARAYWEDLWAPGCYFEAAARRHSFHTAFRRLCGLGAPLFAFVVRSIAGGAVGCSLGAAADYVTLDTRGVDSEGRDSSGRPALLAHELGHALGLLHRGDWTNLMCPFAGRGSALTAWQVAVIRGSRHVTIW